MIYYDKVNVSEGIDNDKINESKVCDICHHYHFSGKGFTLRPDGCNRCHGLLMLSTNLKDAVI